MLDEKVLVVEKNIIMPEEKWFIGFLPSDSFGAYEKLIQQHKQFLPRFQVEEDDNYKQIIPYLIFEHDNRFFIMQRRETASEQRLKNKYSLGIGGHIRQEDMDSESLFAWAAREFDEEVHYSGSYTVQPLGFISNNMTLVERVHMGFVFLLQGDSSDISVKSELKSGGLATLEELDAVYDGMETWSQLVYVWLKAQRSQTLLENKGVCSCAQQ